MDKNHYKKTKWISYVNLSKYEHSGEKYSPIEVTDNGIMVSVSDKYHSKEF